MAVVEFYGPPQFRLNQGTARRWRALLSTPPVQFDPAQLSFDGPDGVYGSPEGLLAFIAQPVPNIGWDGVSHIYDGEHFVLSRRLKDALKLRGTLPDFSSFAHALNCLDQMAAHHGLDIAGDTT